MLTTIAHTVRGLTADAVEKAKSGHPGMPLGCAEIGAVLYSDVLKHDPTDPAWPDQTGSCCPPVMGRCSSIRSFILLATTCL